MLKLPHLCAAVMTFGVLFGGGAAMAEDSLPTALPVSAPAQDEIQKTIERHIHALQTRDSKAISALTPETTRARYKDDRLLLRAQRVKLRALTEGASWTFLGQSDMGDVKVQKLDVTTEDGDHVIVIYRLKQSAPGSWTIEGTTLLDLDAQPI